MIQHFLVYQLMSYKKECIIFMKKKLLTSILLSTVILSQGAALVSVKAETTDEKIAAQDSKINIQLKHKLTRFKDKYLLFKSNKKSLKQKMKNCLLNLQDFLLRLMNCLKTSQLVMSHLQIKLAVPKQMELLLATSIQL